MQPGVTVALATVWLAGAVGVFSATLYPSHPSLDQYSPQLSPKHHEVTQETQDHANSKLHDPKDLLTSKHNQTSNLHPSIEMSNLKLPRGTFLRYGSQDRSYGIGPEQVDLNLSFKDGIQDEIQSKNVAKIQEKKFNKKESHRQKMIDSQQKKSILEEEEEYSDYDSFQDQGPGSIEVYKLDLFEEGSLFDGNLSKNGNKKDETSSNKLENDQKTKKNDTKKNEKKKMNENQLLIPFLKNLKTRTEILSPEVRLTNKLEDHSENESFGMGGVPELQVGCEGVEASLRDKRFSLRNNKDSSHDKEKSSLYPENIVNVQLVYESDEDEDPQGVFYEERDELIKLKKLEQELQNPPPHRGDIPVHLYEEYDKKEKLPVRGDLALAFLDPDWDIMIQNKDIKDRKLLSISQFAPLRRKRDINEDMWGYGEDEGIMPDDVDRRRDEERRREEQRKRDEERRREDARRRADYMRYRQEERRRDHHHNRIDEDKRRRHDEKRRMEEEFRRNSSHRRNWPNNYEKGENDNRRREHTDDRRRSDENRRMEEHRRMLEERRREEDERRRPQEMRRPQEDRRQQTNSERNSHRRQEERRRHEEQRRRNPTRQENDKKLRNYISTNTPIVIGNQPLDDPRSRHDDRYHQPVWMEQKRPKESTRPFNATGIRNLDNRRNYGPSPPNDVGQRNEMDDRRERERKEEERRRADRRRIELEERRLEEEDRRRKSQRYEEERLWHEKMRSQGERMRQEWMHEANRRSQAERRPPWIRPYQYPNSNEKGYQYPPPDFNNKGYQPPPPDLNNKGYQPPPPLPDLNNKGYQPPPPMDLNNKGYQPPPPSPPDLNNKGYQPPPDLNNKGYQPQRVNHEFERDRQRLNQERRRNDMERQNKIREHEDDRYQELKRRQDTVRSLDEYRRRQEEEGLNSLPVSATIIIRPGGSGSTNSSSPVLFSRGGFGSEIDFPGINPNQRGIQAARFPAPATRKPPVKGPGPCIWAVIHCCPRSGRAASCFESLGCPGINWDHNHCNPTIIEAARKEVAKFYNTNQ
ncbi:trichohyalin-like isoform X2 [Leptopilina boulardi]|uniref:trichohyalin-like isoform X2 n=1 Tax=Leptopilina boulardi TaxID=63433 RepID=UPI0021F6292E|nr:trichohyalin-like isoform X2 [Leptopilina boulardi]